MPEPVRVLIFLGGGWHDFTGFAETICSLLSPGGFVVDYTYNPDRFLHLKEKEYGMVLIYTCFVDPGAETTVTGAHKLEQRQVEALTAWVKGGGALLAVHAATVTGRSPSGLRQLIGGSFLSHPEPFVFTVYPIMEKHPITAGLRPFTVYDEFYVEEHDPSVRLHMIAVDRGVAYPMVWSKSEGAGKVAHIALGHDQKVWEHPSYRQLMLQTTYWLTGRSAQ